MKKTLALLGAILSLSFSVNQAVASSIAPPGAPSPPGSTTINYTCAKCEDPLTKTFIVSAAQNKVLQTRPAPPCQMRTVDMQAIIQGTSPNYGVTASGLGAMNLTIANQGNVGGYFTTAVSWSTSVCSGPEITIKYSNPH